MVDEEFVQDTDEVGGSDINYNENYDSDYDGNFNQDIQGNSTSPSIIKGHNLW